MSNSIIDQQRDNETFFWVHSWLPGPVKPYDHEAEFRHMQERGAKLVYTETSESDLMEEIKKLLTPLPGATLSKNPFYWHE